MADDKEFIAWLKRARKLVKKGWTQNAWARNRRGNELVTGSEGAAVCYCAWGAMHKTRPDPEPGWDASEIIEWNDAPGRTQTEVLAMFDNSIAALGG